MSLYGTGRREGFAAALLLAAYVLVVHACAGTSPFASLPAALGAGLPALGGITCYRFLRAQGRSRFTGFLCGAAYAASPWLAAMAQAPRELLAAALAPLALEAVCRFDRPATRSTWLPFVWMCIALPFVAGATVIGVAALALATLGLARTALCGDRDANLPTSRGLLWTALAAGITIVHFVRSDPLAPWLPASIALSGADVLTLHRETMALDLLAVLRVPGPLLVTAVTLGLLRGQRHVDARTWLALTALGAVPTFAMGVPFLVQALPLLSISPTLPGAAWWLSLVALVVLAAAGLDDFLELPMRKHGALPWLLALTALTAPLLPALGACEPAREWRFAVAPPLLAALLFSWRRLGVLRFKRVLAAAALLAAALPVLQCGGALADFAANGPLPAVLPASPLGDVAMAAATPTPKATSASQGHLTLLAALALSALGAGLLAFTRRPLSFAPGAIKAKARG